MNVILKRRNEERETRSRERIRPPNDHVAGRIFMLRREACSNRTCWRAYAFRRL